MKPLLILADHEKVRALKFENPGDDPSRKPHLEEVPLAESRFHRSTISEIVTDQAGRFTQGEAVNRRRGMSYGEEHHLEDELENQAIRHVAQHIREIVVQEGTPRWILVAPGSILRPLQEALGPSIVRSLERTESADLVSLPLVDLEERFIRNF